MRNLIQFLIKHSYWLVLLIYLVVGFAMLFNFNVYHRSIYLSSSNQVSGEIFKTSSNITNYFNLRETNAELLTRNSLLQKRILQLEEQLKKNNSGKLIDDSSETSVFRKYNFITAEVISNSVSHLQNYITLNKGHIDGIAPEMGVIDQNGIIGIVTTVSDHFSVVISVLNPKLKLSAKLKNADYFGSVAWTGESSEFGVLEELPRHVKFNKGDTLITSGYSSVFPEGITIGYMEEKQDALSDGTTPIKIRFSTQYDRLGFVQIITNKFQKEQKEIENQIR
ncbi:MAG: rod shape-determining protein MreC [Bacteroidales bacterium]|nr:rod shape-determining protein MreC [Bacteroidales bacterium]